MKQADEFSDYYQDLLEGRYDCPDRIVLNGYFPLGQQGGGFRHWWRRLTGSDETLDQEHLLRMAGRFSRRVHAYARRHRIPLRHCEPDVDKHRLAEQHRPPDPDFRGLFLILVAKAPALVWEVTTSPRGVPHLERKTPWPYVNHYHFHVIDKEWGHLTFKVSGHPPFGVQVMLNGHEWVERCARQQTISARKEGNCFVGGSDFPALDRLADTLCDDRAIGRLTRVCDRWVYSTCLCFRAGSRCATALRVPVRVFVLPARIQPEPVVCARPGARGGVPRAHRSDPSCPGRPHPEDHLRAQKPAPLAPQVRGRRPAGGTGPQRIDV